MSQVASKKCDRQTQHCKYKTCTWFFLINNCTNMSECLH